MLQKTGDQRFLKTSVFFEQVYLLSQRLGLEYTRALQLVAARAKASIIKSLLLRFASTIASGESEHLFIREETRIESGRYSNEYARSVENLKKWTDSYAAMLVSVTLIVVVAMVSSLLGALDSTFIIIVGATMFLITSGGVYIILRTAPYEQTTYEGDTDGPPDRATAKFLFRVLGPMGLMLGLTAGLVWGVGFGLLALGAFLFPIGYYANRDDQRVRAIDQEVPTFIRSLGSIAGTTNTTLGSALNHLDLQSMGSLEPHIMRLRTRVRSELPAEMSWERFKTDSGNELLRRSTEMMVDGVEMGGNGEEIGEIASSYATTVSESRQVRLMAASTFSFLVIPMHAAMTALLLFILQIVHTFDEKLFEVAAGAGASATGSIPGLDIFKSQDLTLITAVITMVILVLTAANALAPKFAAGGHSLKIASTLSIMCFISGVNMILVPKVAGSLLG